MANMSHELRTPLNGIMGMAQIGQRARTLPKAQEVCGHILESGLHLLELVEAVLDFSSLETGRLQLDHSAFDLHEVIDEVAAACARRAAAKGLNFRLCLAPDLPGHCQGDARRLAQVLDGLLSNAVKFTDRGGVDLTAARQGDQLVFTIADTGIGMEPGQVEGLFRPFEQLDGTATRRYGGMGLGLALAQRLTVLMGGVISVESIPGQGTRFELRLPLSTSVAPHRGDEGLKRTSAADFSI
jgi:signal transduction histidine kinase